MRNILLEFRNRKVHFRFNKIRLNRSNAKLVMVDLLTGNVHELLPACFFFLNKRRCNINDIRFNSVLNVVLSIESGNSMRNNLIY